MVARRVLCGVLGLLMVVGGVACLLAPGETYLSFVWLFGVLALVQGVATCVTWPSRRRAQATDGWDLAWGIVSALFGLALVLSDFVQVLTAVFLAYYLAAWLVVTGVIRIVQALRLRSAAKASADVLPAELAALGPRWGWLLALGILLILCGALCLFNPLVAALVAGTLVGVSVVVLGVDLVMAAFLI
jgi:uncharacterized membrane protein HdeD (DUF308 family)